MAQVVCVERWEFLVSAGLAFLGLECATRQPWAVSHIWGLLDIHSFLADPVCTLVDEAFLQWLELRSGG